MPLTIRINDTDVTNAYWVSKGPITITDAIGQPTQCTLQFEGSLMPTQVVGGELLSVYDEDNIYFDGVIPVENGLGASYIYLDNTKVPETYRKVIQVNAVDFQITLDFRSLPNTILYGMKSGDIIKYLISLTPLRNLCDFSKCMDGYEIPSLNINRRKATNIITDLCTTNGFYFSLRTTQLSPTRRFSVIFRSVNGDPAPFSVDRDANKYVISELKFTPSQNPLINKITLTGGTIPSDDIRTDVFVGDGATGGFALSSIPFFLKPSDVYIGDFSGDLTLTTLSPAATGDYTELDSGGGYVNSPATGPFKAGTLQHGTLQITGPGSLISNTPAKFQKSRYAMWEDMGFDGGSSVIVGLMAAPNSKAMSNVVAGVWFKPDHTISLVINGVENVPACNPVWVDRQASTGTTAYIYGVRIVEALDDNGNSGTQIQIQGGNMSPTRSWLPLSQVSNKATGSFNLAWVGSTRALTAGEKISLIFNDWPYLIPMYTPTAADLADTSLVTMHKNIVEFLNGNAQFALYFSASYDNTGPGFGPNINIDAKQPGSVWNMWMRVDIVTSAGTPSTTLEVMIEGMGGGVDAPSLNNGTELFVGQLCLSGTGFITRIVCRDPVGVNAVMKRALPPELPGIVDPVRLAALQDAQGIVQLSVCGANESDECYTAQVIMEGALAYFSFFDDTDSIPGQGDILEVSYQYSVPLQVTVQDDAGIAAVKAVSKIPGDDGVREGQDVDVSGKTFTLDLARKYAQGYLATRSKVNLQGTVQTTSVHTSGSMPLSGQRLSFALEADGLYQSQAIYQVVSTHMGMLSYFSFAVSFGALPDQYLLPTEDPMLGLTPASLNVTSFGPQESIRIVDSDITFTVQ